MKIHSVHLLGLVLLAASACTVEAVGGSSARRASSERGDAVGATCGVTCETSADCSAAEPYCNYSLGECQATPPACETDADCEVEGDRCWSDGYCWFYPELNCGPGEVVFEGQCSNPACTPERCPAGTELDADTCACEPTGSAPSCSSQSDCDQAYPYCNKDAGVCQTEPPECVGDADCDASAPHCASTGYCEPEAEPNCAPGEIAIDGACEKPVCEAVECPAGSFLDEATCDCVPLCQSGDGGP